MTEINSTVIQILSDFALSLKTQVKNKNLIPHKCSNDHLNNKEDSLTEQINNDEDNKQQLPNLYQTTILNWYNFENSIYRFMTLKESQETVLDILDLLAHRHTGLVKSKIRNSLTLDNLSILGQLRNELKKAMFIKTKNQKKTVLEPSTCNNKSIDIFFDNKNESIKELNEELKEVILDMNEMSVMEEFFNFEAFKNNQEALDLE
ncbi:16908_t:CDS:2 [Cetraspora pellucida]|uniref:16908_t:CDS:1 n=1 Tax=Cetraspora pellucida TaxID=1433469 RepID=A0ACA9NJC5_9GLOM|nr:16908_t:CDS:2 [Cetraspora pellucida]